MPLYRLAQSSVRSEASLNFAHHRHQPGEHRHGIKQGPRSAAVEIIGGEQLAVMIAAIVSAGPDCLRSRDANTAHACVARIARLRAGGGVRATFSTSLSPLGTLLF
jgi:hypothetical protein